MEKLKVGDEVAIAGILKVSAIQPNRNGTVSYSFDRGFALHENMVEQMALKPYEKPAMEKVVEKPTYTGKVVAIEVNPYIVWMGASKNRIGRIFEIRDGFILGDSDTLRFYYGIISDREHPYASFDDFCCRHSHNRWLEIKS